VKPFEKILVSLDLDLVTAPVVALAGQVATTCGARVELIHVFETPGYEGPMTLEVKDAQDPELARWRTARMMMGLLQNLAGHGVQARGRMIFGVVEAELENLARSEHFDLIVIGSHSREGLDRFIQGSVAGALIRNAPCPVLVLPHVQDVIPD